MMFWRGNYNIIRFLYDFQGSIHHHGDYISSGHYNSKIHFTVVVYDCNDHIITKHIPCDEVSNSVYIVIYKPTDQ